MFCCSTRKPCIVQFMALIAAATIYLIYDSHFISKFPQYWLILKREFELVKPSNKPEYRATILNKIVNNCGQHNIVHTAGS